MPTRKKIPFAHLFKDFKERMYKSPTNDQPTFILLMMADTNDATLKEACGKDVKVIRKVFKDMCDHIGYELCAFEITGKDFDFIKLDKTINAIKIRSRDDVVVFYFSGHGYSYADDKKWKYPQLDTRNPIVDEMYNKIKDYNELTLNLAEIVGLMLLLRGARITIGIGDCCNSIISFKRPPKLEETMKGTNELFTNKVKTITKKMFLDANNFVTILISSAQQGQPAVSDPSIGSIFTHCFAKELAATIAKEPKGSRYLPWPKLLKTSSSKAFKASKGYDVGGGKAGKQKAVFEIFVDTMK